jgi:hypothetical protein
MSLAGEIVGPCSPRWSAVLSRVWHEVYQLPEYVAFDADLVSGRPSAFVFENDGGVFLLPFVIREIPGTGRCDAVSPYGYPGPLSDRTDPPFWRQALASLRQTLVQEGLVSLFVRLDPLMPVPLEALSEFGTLMRHGATVSIDLRLTREEWWPQLRKDHREAINRSIRLGRVSVMDDWGYLDEFVSLYEETMTRVHAAPEYFFDQDYFRDLRDAVGERAHLMTVLDEDHHPVAGSVLLTTGGIMQAHLAGSRTTRRREEPFPFMIHEAVRWGRSYGCTAFQLGGGVGGQEDSVFDFKKGFSPNRHDFHTLRIVLDAEAYREMALKADPTADPCDHRGFFPRYRGRRQLAAKGGNSGSSPISRATAAQPPALPHPRRQTRG